MNVQQKVRELRARVERQSVNRFSHRRHDVEHLLETLEVFRNSCVQASSVSETVGQMPPAPNTRRARMGSFLIGIIQRALFWYTPQIVRFQTEAANALNTASRLLETMLQELSEQQHEIRVLRGELTRGRANGSQPLMLEVKPTERMHLRNGCNGAGNALLESFLFANYDRLRGPEAETARKLDSYWHAIQNLSVPDAPWLDLGCGRGEWLIAAGQREQSVIGVDSNSAAVTYCQEAGLCVAQQDALQYLQAARSESMAVITAFHVIEHCRAEDLLVLLRESVRVLKPGGLLIFETPDPANLIMASHLFWRDPSHRQPIPMSLLELMFEYFGLTIVERLRLNCPPLAERLPFHELDFIRQINGHLYGPQDYGLIGRR